jgi:hypothetical protein
VLPLPPWGVLFAHANLKLWTSVLVRIGLYLHGTEMDQRRGSPESKKLPKSLDTHEPTGCRTLHTKSEWQTKWITQRSVTLSRKLGTSGGSNVDMDSHTLSTYRKKISVHNVLKQVAIVRLNHILFLEEKYRTGKERLTIRQAASTR